MNEDDQRQRWISLLLPAATFVVGLALGGTLVYANNGGDNEGGSPPRQAPAPALRRGPATPS